MNRRGRRRPGVAVAVPVALISTVYAAPSVYVLWRAGNLGVDLGELWTDVRAPMWRTVQLAVLTSLCAAVLGTGLGWLLVRTDVPGRRVWRVAAALPLVLPSFVGAAAFLAGMAPTGVVRVTLEAVGYHPPRHFRGLGPSVLVLTLTTYPYVYLPVAARLARLPASLEESARLLADSPRQIVRRVVWPYTRRATLGGALIVFLYSLSEFGAVQLLGYDTLTRVVYATRLADRAQSFGAAGVLLVLAVAVVAIERRLRGEAVSASARVERPARPLPLGRWRPVALGGVILTLTLSLVVPVISLVQWAWRGLGRNGSRLDDLGHELSALGSPARTTALLGVGAAVITVAAVLPVAWHAVHRPGPAAAMASAAVLSGFAVPGIVIALSLVYLALNTPGIDALYQTTPLLVVAYVVHFGSQALGPAETAVGAVPGRLVESARLLGAPWWRRSITVHLPLMRPSLLAGSGLVLLAATKELPATLLLAPTGLDTLAAQVWKTFEEGFYGEAAIAALCLLAVSAVLTWVLVLRRIDRVA